MSSALVIAAWLVEAQSTQQALYRLDMCERTRRPFVTESPQSIAAYTDEINRRVGCLSQALQALPCANDAMTLVDAPA